MSNSHLFVKRHFDPKTFFYLINWRIREFLVIFCSFFRFLQHDMVILARLCDLRSFYDHSPNMWSTITHDHDCWNWVKKYLWSLMIVIWSEMIGDPDPISPTLILGTYILHYKTKRRHSTWPYIVSTTPFHDLVWVPCFEK